MSADTAVAARDVTGDSPLTALASVYDLVADDFAAANRLIPTRLTSDVSLVEEIGQYIVESGGKRLRPLLVLLTARCCGYRRRIPRSRLRRCFFQFLEPFAGSQLRLFRHLLLPLV